MRERYLLFPDAFLHVGEIRQRGGSLADKYYSALGCFSSSTNIAFVLMPAICCFLRRPCAVFRLRSSSFILQPCAVFRHLSQDRQELQSPAGVGLRDPASSPRLIDVILSTCSRLEPKTVEIGLFLLHCSPCRCQGSARATMLAETSALVLHTVQGHASLI